MKKKIIAFCMGICIIVTACGVGITKDNGEKKKETTNEIIESQNEKTPSIVFENYSKDIKDENSQTLLLQVTENCPSIRMNGMEETAEKMNKVFEQQHRTNEIQIEASAKLAQSAYDDLKEEERKDWKAYEFEYQYETSYASPKIVSITGKSSEYQGVQELDLWECSYTFDVTRGKLLTLSDIFTNVKEAKIIVAQHIADTITTEKYAMYLMKDYENYIFDILTEDVFYLNEHGVVVICNPNLVTSYEGGVIEVEIPYEELREVMNETYIHIGRE
ncbi:MAG: RsiV family protein [Lachnospiraceae bacterium]